MKYTREMIIERQRHGEELAFLPLCRQAADPNQLTEACLSPWFECRFSLFERGYRSIEQYMMARMANLFDDRAALARIMKAESPEACRALGEEVEHFDAAIWDQKKYEIALMGNLAKFYQNPELLAYLNDTGDSVLVAINPCDAVWGIKMEADDPGVSNPDAWQGENLFGFALMEARDILREWAAFQWDGEWDEAVEWNHFTEHSDYKLSDGENPDITDYDSTGFIRKDGKWGLLRNDGSEIGRRELIVFYPQWDSCEEMITGYTYDDPPTFDMYYTDSVSGNWGYSRGRLKNTYYFVKVGREGKYGVVDTAGRVVTPCKWDEIDDFGNACQGDLWGFVNLITGVETAPQWPESHRLAPYKYVWSSETVTNWHAMFGPGSSSRRLEWENTMTVFFAESDRAKRE